jgi:hypothetical protein
LTSGSPLRGMLSGVGVSLGEGAGDLVHENQTNAFAIVDLKSGEVVAGKSAANPRLSLGQVEDWYNGQNF